MTQLPSFEDYRRAALAEGFEEVVERRWEPGTVLDTHTHGFALKALVVQGEMWLGVQGVEMRRLVPGDSFALEREVPHAERYGEQGATYWVARKVG